MIEAKETDIMNLSKTGFSLLGMAIALTVIGFMTGQLI